MSEQELNGEHLEKLPIHKGLVNVVVDETTICSVDGIKATLYYRGYPIKELMEKSTFEEVAFLLLFGYLPRLFELESFKKELVRERDIPDRILMLLKSFPRNTTRIELLRTAISALSLYDPDDYDYSKQANLRKGIRIIAKMPTILAFSHRIQSNLPIVEAEKEGKLSHAGNFYYMVTERKPTPEIESAFDKLLICQAEHDLNASTFAARVTVSTLSDIYSGIVSAIGALRGPLHGGANERVILYVLNEIKTKDNALPWVKKKLENKEKIIGFGHRVYKGWDPRALILREYARKFYEMRKNGLLKDEIISQPGEQYNEEVFPIIEELAEFMIKTKNIYPNVDLYSACLLYELGVPPPLYTPLFAVSRCVGWITHAIEQLENNKLLRPRLLYKGELDKKYIEINKR